jgi:hypothetical protein
MTEQTPEIIEQPLTSQSASPIRVIRRLGCGLMIALWFAILLLPGGMFWLATGGEIRIPHINIPEPDYHPFFQINLIMNAQNRGLQMTRTSPVTLDEEHVCVQGNVSYLLWESDDTAVSATYCQCYERADSEADWAFTTQATEACQP